MVAACFINSYMGKHCSLIKYQMMSDLLSLMVKTTLKFIHMSTLLKKRAMEHKQILQIQVIIAQMVVLPLCIIPLMLLTDMALQLTITI